MNIKCCDVFSQKDFCIGGNRMKAFWRLIYMVKGIFHQIPFLGECREWHKTGEIKFPLVKRRIA